jgi:hypothetical protein
MPTSQLTLGTSSLIDVGVIATDLIILFIVTTIILSANRNEEYEVAAKPAS